MSAWRLVADVGGTNTRFARAGREARLDALSVVPTAAHPSFCAALEAYLARSGGRAGCTEVAIGAAGPADGDSIRLTNGSWLLRTREIAEAMRGAAVRLVNDLEAVAHALAHIGAGDVTAIGPLAPPATFDRTRLAVNVGTGFGAAALLPASPAPRAVPGEAGHMSLALTAEQRRIVPDCFRSVEDLLSGRGLATLYTALAGKAGSCGEIAARDAIARGADDPVAERVVAMVTEVLGLVAGDLVLATGAWGGVYLTGSVAEAWSRVADAGSFRRAFEAKGAMAGRMSGVSTALITRPNVALTGLARLPMV